MNVNQKSLYLDVLVLRQAGRNTGQSVVVEVQLTQVGDVAKRAIFHSADLIVAQTKPAGKINKYDETLKCTNVLKNKKHQHKFHKRRKQGSGINVLSPAAKIIVAPERSG